MTGYNRLAKIAEDAGFTYSAPLDISKLEFLQEVRDMCSADKCRSYNKSWSCPPACGTLDEIREHVSSYSSGVLVQTVSECDGSFDLEGMFEAGLRHKDNFMRMWDALDEDNMSVLAMGAGVCMLCEKCTYPDNPCRFPYRLSVSMEACGLYVGKVCKDNGLKYNHGENTITYTSCFLLK